VKELLDLLRNCTAGNGPDSVRSEALRLYCQLLLDSQDPNEAQEVLNILTEAEVTNDPNLNVFKSNALRYAGKLDEAAECLARICSTDNREHAIEAEKLLSHIIDQIEQLEHDCADFQKLLNSSLAIARYCERISLSADGVIPVERACLYLAEILLLSAPGDPQKVSQVERMVAGLPDDGKGENVDFLRCRARLLAAQGKFKEAGALWVSIAKIYRGRSFSPGPRSYQWWRAKFYELYCFSKTPQAKTKDVLHAIEVLENSFAEVPPLWAEKLSLLKEQCR
jgi:tetratricopeptide (TPR) repeat protein